MKYAFSVCFTYKPSDHILTLTLILLVNFCRCLEWWSTVPFWRKHSRGSKVSCLLQLGEDRWEDQHQQPAQGGRSGGWWTSCWRPRYKLPFMDIWNRKSFFNFIVLQIKVFFKNDLIVITKMVRVFYTQTQINLLIYFEEEIIFLNALFAFTLIFHFW